ncbi:MAG: UvrD-helicase domain-containing protein, partial [Synergistaceae bacterium]|jgi:superfamily I DNA/RNA helicase|nr:UvrD-helicase domain-containing protein [Synergistaceae bacterium]
LAAHLPGEAAEALLELATGGKPRYRPPVAPEKSFEHPDVERRFRLVGSAAELEQALSYPWEKWTVFLHPDQRSLVEEDAAGPMRISGSAGTGKTIVALHRAVFLARRYPEARVLLTTFSDILASALKNQLSRLISSRHEPRLMERIDVRSMDGLGRDLYTARRNCTPRIAAKEDIRSILTEAMREIEGHRFKLPFLMSEWEDVIDAWRLETWEAYRKFRRSGRKTRLSEQQRSLLWQVFKRAEERLAELGMMTSSMLFGRLTDDAAQRHNRLYDFIVVDEAQDIGVAQLRFLAALGAHRSDALFFTGDLGQRIFQQPFSWKDLGVDIRGRSRTLRVNYRTSHQIRTHADRLLAPEIYDLDGNTEKRDETVSIFNGPAPTILTVKDEKQERETVRSWISARLNEGAAPHEIGIFVRSDMQIPRAENAVKSLPVSYTILDEKVAAYENTLSIGTMHMAKGLEFKVVVVMACDSDIIPLEARMEDSGDEVEMEEIYNTERHLLYVACTRARDHLLLTGVVPVSEFLDDLGIVDQYGPNRYDRQKHI